MRLSANLSWLYQDLDWPERFGAAVADGFAGAEVLLPYDRPPAWYAAQLRSAGLELTLFNTPVGTGLGWLGWAALPGAAREFAQAFNQARAVADATGCRRIHVMAGDVRGHAAEAWQAALAHSLEQAVRTAEAEGLTLTLEALNREDAAGYAYHHPGQVLQFLRQFDTPALRLQFDYYHCVREALDPLEQVRAAAPWIGYVQIAHAHAHAGTHGRTEPDLARHGMLGAVTALPGLGYDGWLGCEYRPRASVAQGLHWCAPLQVQGVLNETTKEEAR